MSFFKEVILYFWNRKKWWLAPIMFLLLLIGCIVVFANSTVAPFIYSLF